MNQLQTLAIDSLPAAPAAALLGEQTMWSLFANIAYVYRRHFRVLFLCFALPMFPLLLLLELLKNAGPIGLLAGTLLYMMGAFLVSGALTVALSDICLGNQPAVRRSFARILGGNRWWYLTSTTLLYSVAVGLGTVLLLLPGLWLMMRGFFIAIIVALEGRRNRDAIRRSIALSKGQGARIIGLILPSYLLIMLFTMGLTIVAVTLPPLAASVVTVLGNFVVLATLSPAMALTLVLLYYDQRVRRESYDAQALSEDLMR